MARNLTTEQAKEIGRKGGKRSKRGPSESTDKLRNAIRAFLDDNSEQIQDLFDKVSKDDPKGALILFKDMVEFALPKLSRQEVKSEETTVHKVDLTDEQIDSLMQNNWE
jgi:hypothetical protein